MFDYIDLIGSAKNRTHSKIGVRFCSIAEPNRTIGVRLGSIGFCSVLFDWIGRAISRQTPEFIFYAMLLYSNCKNKLTSVFHASVLLLTMKVIITRAVIKVAP